MDFDFHTHNLEAPAGRAIINLPIDALRTPDTFPFRTGALYSVGLHPWWLEDPTDASHLWKTLKNLAERDDVVAIGECGFDRLRGDFQLQREYFPRHVALSEELRKPLTIHCVRAFDVLLAERKRLLPHQTWTVHGFRGKPALAQQLLTAGLDLSFGTHHNLESYRLTPPARRHQETDDDYQAL